MPELGSFPPLLLPDSRMSFTTCHAYAVSEISDAIRVAGSLRQGPCLGQRKVAQGVEVLNLDIPCEMTQDILLVMSRANEHQSRRFGLATSRHCSTTAS